MEILIYIPFQSGWQQPASSNSSAASRHVHLQIVEGLKTVKTARFNNYIDCPPQPTPTYSPQLQFILKVLAARQQDYRMQTMSWNAL